MPLNSVCKYALIGAKSVLVGIVLWQQVGEAADSPKASRTAGLPQFFAQHCMSCHGVDLQEAGFRLDDASTDPASADFGHPWARALERINSGEMPPKTEPQPTAAERFAAAEWISNGLRTWEANRYATREKVSFKKLTRVEYANTLHDLLGVTYHPTDPGGLPEDPNWRGFERIGTVLTLSPSHIERYIAAAETALKQAIPLSDTPTPWKIRWNALGMNYGVIEPEVSLPRRWISEKHRLVVLPNGNWRSGPGGLINVNFPRAGEYRVRIKASGLRPAGGHLPHLVFHNASLDRPLVERDVDAAEDKPTIIEARFWVPAGGQDIVLKNDLPGPSFYEAGTRVSAADEFISLRNGRSPKLLKVTDENYQPLYSLLILDWVEIEAVVDSWPPQAQQQFLTVGVQDAKHVQSIIRSFAERAFRRPVTKSEVDQYAQVANGARATGASFEESLRDAFLAILTAHDFLFLVEGAVDKPQPRLNDWQLASRLSYFLWSTMPDEQLFAKSRAGVLTQRDVLATELQRMIQDPRSRCFTDDFSRQWLQLRDVGKFPPDKKLYPTYDAQMQKSMIAEPQQFFCRVFAENRSIREFIHSDWTMLNGRLAEHYGLSGVVDDTLRPVTLAAETHRGGLLTQAAPLSLTSDGSRHRPVHRGKWVLESMFGTSPPPPPPNAGTIPTPVAGEPPKTLRAKLEAHRTNANCAACHARIDPYGLAFDNYDAIGRWRSEELAAPDQPLALPIDATGVLPDGRTFDNPDEFKQLLVADIDRVAEALVEKLTCYALRREHLSPTARQSGKLLAKPKRTIIVCKIW